MRFYLLKTEKGSSGRFVLFNMEILLYKIIRFELLLVMLIV